MATPADPRFKYPRVPESPVTSEKLNDLWKVVVSASGSRWNSIVAGVQIVILGILLWSLRSIMALERQRAKQQYEQDQAHDNQDEVDQPDPAAP